MSLMTFTPERARAMIQSTVMMRGMAARSGHAEYCECRKLARLEVVDLVDEPLEFGDGVASLVWGHALIDARAITLAFSRI